MNLNDNHDNAETDLQVDMMNDLVLKKFHSPFFCTHVAFMPKSS